MFISSFFFFIIFVVCSTAVLTVEWATEPPFFLENLQERVVHAKFSKISSFFLDNSKLYDLMMQNTCSLYDRQNLYI